MVRGKFSCGSSKDVQDEVLEERRVQSSPGKLPSSHRKFVAENKEDMKIVKQVEANIRKKQANLETIELSESELKSKGKLKTKEPVWKRRLLRIGKRKATDEDSRTTDNSSAASSYDPASAEKQSKAENNEEEDVISIELSKQLSVKIFPSQKDTPSSRCSPSNTPEAGSLTANVKQASAKGSGKKGDTVKSPPSPNPSQKGHLVSPRNTPKSIGKKMIMTMSPTNIQTATAQEDSTTVTSASTSSAFTSLGSVSLMSGDKSESITKNRNITDGDSNEDSRESKTSSNRDPVKLPAVLRSMETYPSTMGSSIPDDMFTLETPTMYTGASLESTPSTAQYRSSDNEEEDDDDDDDVDDDSDDEGCSNVFAEDLRLFSSLFMRCRGQQEQPTKNRRSRP